jgi:hypothetical protein
MLLQWAPHLETAVLVVVPTQYAALMLIESFVEVKKWKRWQLQLRTGANKDDDFSEEKTKISVVTYGMLWLPPIVDAIQRLPSGRVRHFYDRRQKSNDAAAAASRVRTHHVQISPVEF